MRARQIGGSTALLLVLLTSVACGKHLTGSGNVVSRELPVASFSKLQVSHGFSVRVSIGAPSALTVRVDDNIVNELDVGVASDALRIGLKGGTSVSQATLEADVTAPSLSAIEASGGSTITPTAPIESSPFTLTMSGASRFDGSLALSEGTVGLSGASDAALSGTASRLTATLSGASHLDAPDLTVNALTIDLSGASRGEVNVTQTISASASGASNLTYEGSPTFTRKEKSGGSQINGA
jgi:hypothetical protein